MSTLLVRLAAPVCQVLLLIQHGAWMVLELALIRTCQMLLHSAQQ